MKRFCKNKNCRKELPENYNKPYCQSCMNKQVKKAKLGIKGSLGLLVSLVLVVISKGKFGKK